MESSPCQWYMALFLLAKCYYHSMNFPMESSPNQWGWTLLPQKIVALTSFPRFNISQILHHDVIWDSEFSLPSHSSKFPKSFPMMWFGTHTKDLYVMEWIPNQWAMALLSLTWCDKLIFVAYLDIFSYCKFCP